MSSGVNTLIMDPEDRSLLYAGTEDGVFRSDFSASVWIGAGLSGRLVERLVIDPARPQVLYAGCGGSGGSGLLGDGVYRSGNRAATWSTVNEDLTSTWIYALAVDPLDRYRVLSGSRGGGAYEYRFTYATDSDDSSCVVVAATRGSWMGLHLGALRRFRDGAPSRRTGRALGDPRLRAALAFPGPSRASEWGGSMLRPDRTHTPGDPHPKAVLGASTGADLAPVAVSTSSSPDSRQGSIAEVGESPRFIDLSGTSFPSIGFDAKCFLPGLTP